VYRILTLFACCWWLMSLGERGAGRKFVSTSMMDPRLFLQAPPLASNAAGRYFFDGRSVVVAPSSSHLPFYQLHHVYHHQQQQQHLRHWNTTAGVWSAQSSRDRKLFSVDAILNRADSWRTDGQSSSRFETSDVSGKLRQAYTRCWFSIRKKRRVLRKQRV